MAGSFEKLVLWEFIAASSDENHACGRVKQQVRKNCITL